ncbi:MAG: hypothetical protein ABI024_14245 [Vicinamibacterales bacterium]
MSRSTRFVPFVSLALLLVFSVACDERLSDVAGPTPNLQPTFATIQREIFNAPDSSGRLGCTPCHSDAGRAASGGLVLLEGRSYQGLVGQPSRQKAGATLVVPGDPGNSYLLKKLEGAPDIAGVRMPRSNGPFLTAGQISIIRRWIELGAKND